jgi:hypothetical protein
VRGEDGEGEDGGGRGERRPVRVGGQAAEQRAVGVDGALRVPRLARFDTEMPDAVPDDLLGVETLKERRRTAGV